MNADTGRVLFEKNGRESRYPASLTKIATAAYILQLRGEKLQNLVEIEHEAVAMVTQEAKRRSSFTLPSWWLEPGTTHMGLKKGEKISLEDLLWGTMLCSAGDACNALALYIGGTVPEFMKDLNGYLQSLGLKDTYFNNPHGLHHPKHMTTAYDLALLTKHSLQIPKFKHIVRQLSYTRAKTNKSEPITLYQSNKLLKKGTYFYPPAIGVKTGFTQSAGLNLVAAAQKGDRCLIAVIMGAEDREALYKEAIRLFESAFNEKKKRVLAFKAGLLSFKQEIKGAKTPLQLYLQNDITFDFYPQEEPKVNFRIALEPLDLPIQKGEQVAFLELFDQEGRLLKKAPLVAHEKVVKGFWQRVKDYFF